MKQVFGLPLLLVLAAGLAFAALGSCSSKGTKTSVDKPNPTLPTLILKSGSVEVKAEVADEELERNRGLMFRKTLEDGKGMLFVFDKDEKVAFWMKNTSLPLSIAYMGADGTIHQILDLVPFSEEARPSERSVRYALEVPQGWFGRVGLGVGSRFEIPSTR
jgi:hypothetical protein